MIHRHLIQIEKYETERLFIDDLCQPESFFCIVEEVAQYAPIGYIGIKDTQAEIWEIGIELDRQHTQRGFGPRSIRLFLNELQLITGQSEYKAIVKANNYPFQKCLGNLGATFVRLCDGPILKLQEEKEKFEDRNLHLIDDSIKRLAVQLGVEPRKLLSHVLEYRMTCPL